MERHEVIILRRRNYREADRIITLISPTAGKREALVRGARKTLSKLSPGLEPFRIVRLELIPGRRFPHVIGATVVDHFRNLHRSLPGLAAAGFACDVVDGLTRLAETDPRFYRLLSAELRRVNHRTDPADSRLSTADSLGLSLFTLRCIAVAGWKPDLTLCSVCHRPLGNVRSVFLSHPFGLAHLACAPSGTPGPLISPSTRQYLSRRLQAHVRSQVVGRAVFREVGALALSALEAVIDRRLASRRFLRLLTGR